MKCRIYKIGADKPFAAASAVNVYKVEGWSMPGKPAIHHHINHDTDIACVGGCVGGCEGRYWCRDFDQRVFDVETGLRWCTGVYF